MRLYIDFDENSEEGRYFLVCARIRDISAKSVLRRLFEVICKDQLVSSVLDDSEKVRDRKKGEHRYSEPALNRDDA